MRISDWSSDVCSSDLAGDDFYCAERRLGQWFYCSKPRATEPEKQAVPVPSSAVERMSAITRQLDELLEAVRDKHPDNGGLLTGVVLSASPTKVVVARSSKQKIGRAHV